MIFLRLLADYLLLHFMTFINFRESEARYEGVHREKELSEAANILVFTEIIIPLWEPKHTRPCFLYFSTQKGSSYRLILSIRE